MNLKTITAHKWFALADLLLVAASILVMLLKPGLGGLPLLLAVLPWFLRVCARRFPFQRTRFDWLIILFLITAAVGVWAAYDPLEAWKKFWLLAGGVFLFYALAGQPEENHWQIAWFASLVGVGTALFFLLAYNWQLHPAKIGLINQAGLWWMKVRPEVLTGAALPSNFADIVAGILAFTTPFLIANGWKAWQERILQAAAWFLFSSLVTGVGFMAAISRGATIALGVGLGVWLIWAAIYRFKPALMKHWNVVFAVGIALAALFIIVLFVIDRNEPAPLLNSLYRLFAASDRQEVASGAVKLFEDFRFTGGGLGSFAGLYSQYILGVPYFFTINSFNLFLDVAVEQGIVGLLAVILMFGGSAGLLLSASEKSNNRLLHQAAFSSLVIITLHGMVDEIVYGQNSVFLLFVLPGIACAYSRSALGGSQMRHFKRPLTLSLLAAAAGVGILLLVNWPALSAAWQADLGAVQMAKIELKDFPTQTWVEGSLAQDLAPVELQFRRALQLNPAQKTANYRMGRIAMVRRDFTEAADYLSRAQQVDPTHPGITKFLGLSYTWNGQFEQAIPLLSQIPGARQELGAYAWWWQTQGREDLSAYAAQMEKQLEK